MTPILVREGTALFVAEPGRNADETLRNPIALEVYPPMSGAAGGGLLFLDDGESDSAARFILEATIRGDDPEFRINLQQRVDSFAPQQQDLELRLPPAFGSILLDGSRIALSQGSVAAEGRRLAMACTRIPLAAKDLYCARGISCAVMDLS